MSQAQIGNLNVKLGIDTAQFSSGVKQAQGSLGAMAGALKGFAAAFSASMIFDSAVTAMKAVAEIGDVAESIGVSAEQLQTFNKMALASGTSTDVLTRGLQSIAEQSVDAGSKLGQLFEANGLAMKGKDTNQVIREFMDLVRNAASPTEQLAIITGVLGDKVGRQLVEAFRDGAAGADEATRQMVASGEYHTNAEVERLQHLETEYNKVVNRIQTYWQKMILGMVNGIDLLNKQVDIGFGIKLGPGGSMIDQINDALAKSTPTVNMGPMGGPGQFPALPAKKYQSTVLPPSGTAAASKSEVDKEIIPPGTLEDIYGAGKAVSALEEAFKGATPEAGLFSDTLLMIGDTIQSSLSDALSGLITGTMSARDAFTQMAQSIIQSLADIAAELASSALLKMFLGSLGGGGGAGFNFGGMSFGGIYGNGGTLGAGQWGIAGERGPEIIHGPARITPMDKVGGQTNVTVNNYAGADVRTRQGADGSTQIDIIKAEIAKDLARGGNSLSQAVERGYGLRRAGR